MMDLNSSIDEKEVEKFSTHANRWWSFKGPVTLLHKQGPSIRIPLLTEELRVRGKTLSGLKLLDVGCGAGISCESFAMLEMDVTGIDPAFKLIEAAKEHLALHDDLKVNYICDTVENHCINNKETYDVVVMFDVAEHVADLRSILKASIETLKPGGSILIATWNRTFIGWFYGIFILETIFGIIPRGTHSHSMFVKPSEIDEILKENNCKTVSVRGIWYGFFKQDWYFTKSDKLFYALHAIKN